MKVKELMNMLRNVDPDMTVLMPYDHMLEHFEVASVIIRKFIHDKEEMKFHEDEAGQDTCITFGS